MIRFSCPGCKAVCSVGDDRGGSVVACPKCGQRMRAPFPVAIPLQPVAGPAGRSEHVTERPRADPPQTPVPDLELPPLPKLSAEPVTPPPTEEKPGKITQEQIFLQEPGIVVTNARVMVPDQTYAMSLVTSVKRTRDQENKSTAVGCLGLSATGAFIAAVTTGFGGLTIFLGAVTAVLVLVAVLSPVYHVIGLVTAAREERVLRTTDQALADRVVEAVNRAIVSRG